MYFRPQASEPGTEQGINFKDFVKALARFRRDDGRKSHPLNKTENKLECKSIILSMIMFYYYMY